MTRNGRTVDSAPKGAGITGKSAYALGTMDIEPYSGGKRVRDRNENNRKIAEKLQQYIEAAQFFDDGSDDYMYIYDLTAQRVFLTDKIREKFPIPPAGEDGNDFSAWYDIVYHKDRNLMDHYRNLLSQEKISSFNIAYRILDRAGNKVWIRVKGALRKREDTQALLIAGRISEISRGRMMDSITGLCCTEKLMEDLRQHLKTSDGYLMVLNLDDFKQLNMTQGRAFCDEVLKKVAIILEECAQEPIELYRLEGDSFAINFLEKKKEDVEAFYSTVQKGLENICTASVGVVKYRCRDAADSDTIYLYAETALDQAKKEGKNRMIFFSADNYRKNLKQMELEAELKVCVEDSCRGFYLVYQPQINSRDFSLHGVEALLRYRSPLGETISPGEFIPHLEQTGLICPVGEWVLKTAVAQCKKWRAYLPDLHVSVNMSYIQLQQEGVADMVLRVLHEAGLPGEALTLELTENVQLQNYHHFNKIFYRWKQNGIRISIDDFGTGYSSLSYLKSIAIDEVKIDRCFVNQVSYNAYNFRLLSNMIELAHSARIKVCCEGMETLEELMALQELHTDLLQGFFFARPCTVQAFEEAYICSESEAYRERKEKEANLHQLDDVQCQEFLEELRNEEIGNITESMDEVVYVSDPETYELYYLNAAGRRMTGVYDYKGSKCYKVLQGKDGPCKFCTNSQLCKDEFLIWERENTFFRRHFILKDKLIPWKGKMARVEMAIDITEKEILSQAIQKRLNLERVIVDSCKILVREPNTEKSVRQVLKIMGEFCQGDRAYVLKPCPDGKKWDLHWQWCAHGAEPVHVPVPAELERSSGEDSGQRIVHPIVRDHKTVGYVGIDNPHHAEVGKDLVKTMAYFLGYTSLGEEMQTKKQDRHPEEEAPSEPGAGPKDGLS